MGTLGVVYHSGCSIFHQPSVGEKDAGKDAGKGGEGLFLGQLININGLG